MKLRRLDLLRYGHLSDAALDFADGARLHVVHGANEAGKSTALAAIADALFGFGHRTEFDFLHGASQLRVGFTVAAREGAMGIFIRRKGRRDTLRDAADRVVPDDTLARFLGGASRNLFESEFGLDGGRLREGGQALLRSGGEVGESLLAGIGLLHLRSVLARFEDEAKLLVGDGRGRRRLSDAVEAWRTAQRETEERAVAPRAWQETDTAYAQAVGALAQVQDQIRALSEESSQLQRIRRVAPLLAELANARATLAALADAPHLPFDAEGRLRDLLAIRRDTARDAERETAEAQRLVLERAALPLDAAALAAQDAIDDLASRRPVALQAMSDLPAVRASVAASRSAVEDAVRGLGLAFAPEAARDALPAVAARRAVQRLISQHAALAASAAVASRDLAAARRRRDQAAEALQAAPVPASPALLRRTIEAVRGEGPLDAELTRAQRALAEAGRAIASALASLPLWHRDIAALVACPVPLVADTEAAAVHLDAAAKGLEQARAAAKRINDEIGEVEEKSAHIACGETVPTPDAVATARSARDRIWRLIRRMLEGGPAPTADETAALAAVPMPDAFEGLRDEADRLADRRADDAQLVADFLAATARLNLLRARREQTATTLAKAEQEVAAANDRWRTLWAPAGLAAGTPAAMAEWRRARADLLGLAEDRRSARLRHDELAARRDAARARLAALLPAAAEPEALAALLSRAETACAAAEAKETEYRAREKRLGDEEERLPEQRQAVEMTASALEAWQLDWAPAVAALGLAKDASIDAAEAALAAWARIAETVPAWNTDARRIADMEATIAAFVADVRAAQTSASEPVSEEPSPLTAARLLRRLASTREAASNAADLTERIAAHEAAGAQARRRLAEVETELEAMRRMAGAADDEALQCAIERARHRDSAIENVTRTERTLLTQGDGMAEEALWAEASRTGPDAAVGRLTQIGTELATLGERREELSAQRTRAETLLAQMREGRDAATKAQEAENALAEARSVAERFARLHVARVLLRAGIERFRKEQQGPLLQAAGANFALLTGGRYAGITVDHDAAGKTILLAVRDIGTECPVEALSEGTRDQLYLALRIAAVESYARRSEPLPFVADDLLVQFDDGRAAAALTLLARLGRTTQVILFTHHDHVAALAARQPGVDIQYMQAMPGAFPISLAVA